MDDWSNISTFLSNLEFYWNDRNSVVQTSYKRIKLLHRVFLSNKFDANFGRATTKFSWRGVRMIYQYINVDHNGLVILVMISNCMVSAVSIYNWYSYSWKMFDNFLCREFCFSTRWWYSSLYSYHEGIEKANDNFARLRL